MNIDEYRAYKAQMEEEMKKQQERKEEQPSEPPKDEPKVETQPEEAKKVEPSTEVQPETPPQEQEPEKTSVPEKLVINGEEVTLEQIQEWKNGYLRQSDYTKKAQELARQRQEIEEALRVIEQIRSNPELAQQIATQTQVPTLDPYTAKMQELEARMYDMMLEKEVESLSHKYPDFEVREVLTIAQEKQMTNLEDAYFIWKARQQVSKPKSQETASPQPSFNMEELKEQLRQELLNELKAQQTPDVPKSIITTQGSTPPKTEPPIKLSASEVKVAKALGMTPEEYAQWRNKK